MRYDATDCDVPLTRGLNFPQYDKLKAAVRASPGGFNALAPELRQWIAEYAYPFQVASLRFSEPFDG